VVVSNKNSHHDSFPGKLKRGSGIRNVMVVPGTQYSFNLKLSIQQERALLHSNKAERPARLRLLGIKTPAVIVNL